MTLDPGLEAADVELVVSNAQPFTYHVEPRSGGRAFLIIPCKATPHGECRFSLWRDAASGIMWHWDGDVERPTISPSIDCKGGCERHFTMVNGVPNG